LSQVLGFDCTISRSLVLQRKYSMCFFHFCTPTQQFKMEHKNQKKLIVFSFLHDMKFCLFLHEASCISLPGGFNSCGFIKKWVSTWLCCIFILFCTKEGIMFQNLSMHKWNTFILRLRRIPIWSISHIKSHLF
jgi:hypothetical protein